MVDVLWMECLNNFLRSSAVLIEFYINISLKGAGVTEEIQKALQGFKIS